MRKILIVLFSIGTVAGFGSEIAGWHHCANHRRAAFEQHVADVCVNAARNEGRGADRAGNWDDPWAADRYGDRERGRPGHHGRGHHGPPGYADPPPPADDR
jgi:hypothetical protein